MDLLARVKDFFSVDFIRKLVLVSSVPIAAGVFGYFNTKATMAPSYIDIAVSVLRVPPSDPSQPLRHWAVDLLNKHSEVKLTAEQRRALLEGALPNSDQEIWLQSVALGSICTGTEYAYGDTVSFHLQSYGMVVFSEVSEVVLTVESARSTTVVYRDTIPFTGGITRTALATTELGRGFFRAEMMFEFDDPINKRSENVRTFAAGVCAFSVE